MRSMMPAKYQGTGESGLKKPMSKERYESDVSLDMIDVVLEASCSVFGCEQPTQVDVIEVDINKWGKYWYYTKVITLHRPILGVLIHELAHHISRELYTIPKHTHHEEHFWDTLQELHDMWR